MSSMAHSFPISFADSFAWYCAYTDAHSVERVGEQLEQAGFEVFIPRERVWVKHARKKTEKLRPLLGSYFFLRLNLGRPEFFTWEEQRNAVSLLPAGRIPLAIPTAWIDDMRAAIDIGVFDETTAVTRLAPGDDVRIVKGAFAGFIAKLKSAKGKKRIEVVLSLFGCERPVELKLEDLRVA